MLKPVVVATMNPLSRIVKIEKIMVVTVKCTVFPILRITIILVAIASEPVNEKKSPHFIRAV